jgi:uncharacterized OsmC-like protein
MTDSVVYQSHVRLERVKGHIRRAYLPAEAQPIHFGVHDELAAYYRVEPGEEEAHAEPLDYLVAATGASLLGVFGNALESRKIPTADGRLTADVVGDVVTEDRVLVLRRLHVTYHLILEDAHRATARRVHSFHARYSSLARTLEESVEITTTLEMSSAQ